MDNYIKKLEEANDILTKELDDIYEKFDDMSKRNECQCGVINLLINYYRWSILGKASDYLYNKNSNGDTLRNIHLCDQVPLVGSYIGGPGNVLIGTCQFYNEFLVNTNRSKSPIVLEDNVNHELVSEFNNQIENSINNCFLDGLIKDILKNMLIEEDSLEAFCNLFYEYIIDKEKYFDE